MAAPNFGVDVDADIIVDDATVEFRPRYDPVSPGRPYLLIDGRVASMSGQLPGGANRWRFRDPKQPVHLVYEFSDDELADLARAGLFRPEFSTRRLLGRTLTVSSWADIALVRCGRVMKAVGKLFDPQGLAVDSTYTPLNAAEILAAQDLPARQNIIEADHEREAAGSFVYNPLPDPQLSGLDRERFQEPAMEFDIEPEPGTEPAFEPMARADAHIDPAYAERLMRAINEREHASSPQAQAEATLERMIRDGIDPQLVEAYRAHLDAKPSRRMRAGIMQTLINGDDELARRAKASLEELGDIDRAVDALAAGPAASAAPDTDTIEPDKDATEPDKDTIEPDTDAIDARPDTVGRDSVDAHPDAGAIEPDNDAVEPDKDTVDVQPDTAGPDAAMDEPWQEPDTAEAAADTSGPEPDGPEAGATGSNDAVRQGVPALAVPALADGVFVRHEARPDAYEYPPAVRLDPGMLGETGGEWDGYEDDEDMEF